jgi:hypothetical protein
MRRNWQYMRGLRSIRLEISFGRNEIVAAMDQCVGVKPEYASKSSAITLDVSKSHVCMTANLLVGSWHASRMQFCAVAVRIWTCPEPRVHQ